MNLHIYKIEEDRIADRSEVYVYGAFTVAEAKDKAESIWRHLTDAERKHASICAQGFDLNTDLIPDTLLDELDLPHNFNPHDLSDEQLSLLLSGIDEGIMLPPYDIAANIGKED